MPSHEEPRPIETGSHAPRPGNHALPGHGQTSPPVPAPLTPGPSVEALPQAHSGLLTPLIALATLSFCACSGSEQPRDINPAEETAQDSADARSDSVADACLALRTLGQPCADHCQCISGTCALNEWAPFRFCTSQCTGTKPGTLCPPEAGTDKSTSLCLQLPPETQGTPQRFCAPLCQQGITDCKATGNPWESCEAPTYKLVPLLDTSDKVCSAPSAHGFPPLDPDTCEGWENRYQNWPNLIDQCVTYCQFLQQCFFTPTDLPTPCCQYACARRIAPVGAPDKELLDHVECLAQEYAGFRQCQRPVDSCGELLDLNL